jgi:hypothetical protein
MRGRKKRTMKEADECSEAQCRPQPVDDVGHLGGVEHAPWRDGELHHRRKGMDLRGTHDEILVDCRLIEE